jgi:hypothetical protein
LLLIRNDKAEEYKLWNNIKNFMSMLPHALKITHLFSVLIFSRVADFTRNEISQHMNHIHIHLFI